MAKKTKSLVDAYLFREAKDEVNKLNKGNNIKDTIRTPSGQDNTVIIPVQEQYDNVVIPVQEQHDNVQSNVIRPVQGQDQDTAKQGQDQDRITSKKLRLSKQQQAIYDWFLQKGFSGTFNKPQIARETGIPLETIRKSIKKFQNFDLIFLEYDTCIKEYEYQINTKITITRTDTTRTPSGHHSNVIEPVKNSHCSSSLLYKKTTTTKALEQHNLENITNELNNNPELIYWRRKNLKAKQIANWMEIANCGLESIIEYLSYCRFEMEELGIEKDKPVKNVFNYFFRILERTGAYPKPSGYKSYYEKQIEAEKQILQDRQEKINALKALHRQKWEQEQELKFWEMMNDPESALYRKCFEGLSEFEKGRVRKGGKTGELSMRKVFDQICEEEGEGA